MKFLSKITKTRGGEDDDDLDLDGQDELAEEVSEDGEGGPGRGVLGKLFRRKSDGNEEEVEVDGGDEFPKADVDSPVQGVRLEGVADVRPVGPSAAAMTPSEEKRSDREGGPAGPEASTSNGQSAAAATTATVEDTGEESPDDFGSQDNAPAEEVNGGEPDKGGMDFSLSDIFEEAIEVDENLKDLADSQEDVAAGDLAGELREFLAELEE